MIKRIIKLIFLFHLCFSGSLYAILIRGEEITDVLYTSKKPKKKTANEKILKKYLENCAKQVNG